MRPKKWAGVEFAARPGRRAKPLDKASQANWSVAHAEPEAPKKRLTDEQAELAGEHWDRAMKVARAWEKKYPFVRINWESAAAVGLCDAAFMFDPSRGNAFWTAAYTRVCGAMLDAMRLESRVKGFSRRNGICRNAEAPRIDSLASVSSSDTAEKPATLADRLADADAGGQSELEAAEDFAHAISCLPFPHRDIVRLYYRHDRTMREIGEELGLSESRVSQLHSAALRRLRESRVAREALAG